ncbi:CCR4-NOT transcription complex subunit 7-like [Centruroides sculpturatus]|uniref:CCR4-NOT transcription complex subunit 7-like n=1 Tax=Centruroides sculpturatus TaxID=218467 RepID=UPI000C6CB5BF|nr:CCR4-NOT transcription complex subunit 7-like [Centruroides sculpturatus]
MRAPSGLSSGNNINNQCHISNEACGIKDVWSKNLEEEFKAIRHIVQKYSYVAMDTEFPGVVARPIGEFKSSAEYQYQLLRCNVDLLKIIQLGLTFLDEEGGTPSGYSTWQFNFKFNLTTGTTPLNFCQLMSGTYSDQNKIMKELEIPVATRLVYWIATNNLYYLDYTYWIFSSGYDFGYLLKLLTNQNLPSEESEFFELLHIYFPAVYDVKYLMKSCKNLKGGLQEVAEQLELERIGPQHQAGSDSLLTGAAFFKMREMFFEDNIDDAKYCGHLYGLGTSYTVNGQPEDALNVS